MKTNKKKEENMIFKRKDLLHKMFSICMEITEKTDYDTWFEYHGSAEVITVDVYPKGKTPSVDVIEFRFYISENLRVKTKTLNKHIKVLKEFLDKEKIQNKKGENK
jgi:hypothetical protein